MVRFAISNTSSKAITLSIEPLTQDFMIDIDQKAILEIHGDSSAMRDIQIGDNAVSFWMNSKETGSININGSKVDILL